MLPVVKKKTLTNIVNSFNSLNDGQTNEELYKDLFHQQPMLKMLIQAVIESDHTEEFVQGYCRGLFQSWYLLNQQDMINELEEVS